MVDFLSERKPALIPSFSFQLSSDTLFLGLPFLEFLSYNAKNPIFFHCLVGCSERFYYRLSSSLHVEDLRRLNATVQYVRLLTLPLFLNKSSSL
jgi:hypothetical protein